MYISLGDMALAVLFVLGVVALVLLILVLIKNLRFYSTISALLEKNKDNIDETLATLPKASKNVLEISEDLKSVGNVITETTASVLETKEHITDYITIFKDVVTIIRKVFSKD